jgi:hypothetical protein
VLLVIPARQLQRELIAARAQRWGPVSAGKVWQSTDNARSRCTGSTISGKIYIVFVMLDFSLWQDVIVIFVC